MVPGEVSRAVSGNGYARAGEELSDFGHVLMMALHVRGFVPPGRALFHGVGYRPVGEKIQGRAFFHRAFPDPLPDFVEVGGNVTFSMAREYLVFNGRRGTVVQRIVLVDDCAENQFRGQDFRLVAPRGACGRGVLVELFVRLSLESGA